MSCGEMDMEEVVIGARLTGLFWKLKVLDPVQDVQDVQGAGNGEDSWFGSCCGS